MMSVGRGPTHFWNNICITPQHSFTRYLSTLNGIHMVKSIAPPLKTIFVVLSVCLSLAAFAQTKTEKLNELITAYADHGNFNGSVLVAQKGEILYKKAFGLANAEWDIPNQTDTKFRLASITKQFTAMLIVQLVAEGKVKLDVPISTYLPDYPPTGNSVTLHHLLTHSSGIPSYTSYPNYREFMGDAFTPGELVELFADSALEFTPGTEFRYSNSGYALLGHIIERVTGKTYEQVLQEKIFTPLKMHNSGYDHHSVVIKNRAAGYYRFGTTFQNSHYIDMSVPFAAGAIYSTVADLYLWDRALYTEQLLPEKYRDLVFDTHIVDGGGHYGYGWEIGTIAIGSSGEKIARIGHGGGINGFGTLISRIPSDESLVVILDNTGGQSNYNMTVAIMGILYDKPYLFPQRSVANALLEAISKGGIDAAVSHYKSIKDSPDYRLNEGEMNTAGYQLLQSGRAKEAAAIFKLNVEAYPNAFNPYDSYGEALLALGDTAQAIENYKKSIQLNPGNEGGLRVLKSLGVNTDAFIKKISPEQLKLLEGEYLVTNPPSETEKNWRIVFQLVNGELTGNDRGYRYRLVPVGDNAFINPDDGASLTFDTSDKNGVTMMLFGRFEFKKIYP